MENLKELYESLKENRYFEYFEVKTQYEKRDMPREELIDYFKSESQRIAPYMNKYENPFMNIMSFEDKLIPMFSPGDHVVIQEKIDGSNAHLQVSTKGFASYGLHRLDCFQGKVITIFSESLSVSASLYNPKSLAHPSSSKESHSSLGGKPS